jgi:hypothetical protein
MRVAIQRFDPVSAASAKQEQRWGKWVQVELCLHGTRQTVDTTAQVSIAAGDVDGTVASKVVQHDFTA